MKTFMPKTVIIRENALEYPLGEKLYNLFQKEDVDLHIVSERGHFPFDYNVSFNKNFHRAKKTVLITVRSLSKFQSCKPSAHYQLPLVSGCPAHCHYCYLSTNLGKKPYIKIYVNIEEIFEKAKKYMKERAPEETIFEGAATSDPLPVEKWSGSLSKTIKFFANSKLGRFRFVSKFSEVDPFLDLKHNKRTEIRFSLNSKYAIKKFEPTTPPLKERIEASKKIHAADYPLGFLIAPIFIYDGWEKEYEELIKKLSTVLANNGRNISFELITHRFTERAKKVIEKAYPNTELPMNEEVRDFKYGQFGYGKYVYPAKTMKKTENFFREKINKYLPETEIKYFV